MSSVTELKAQQAQIAALIVEATKKEEERERVEAKRKAEEAMEAKCKADEAMEKKQKVDEAEERQRMEEVVEKNKKVAAKALANRLKIHQQ